MRFFVGLFFGIVLGFIAGHPAGRYDGMKYIYGEAVKAKAGIYEADPVTGETKFVWFVPTNCPEKENK